MKKTAKQTAPKSAAQAYRELIAKQQESSEMFDVLCPSGMTFQCSRPDVKMYYASGRLPEFLQNQMAIVQAVFDAKDFEQDVKENEELQEKILNNTKFIRDMIFKHVHNPRIVEKPQSADELGFDELSSADFDYLSRWMVSGGGEDAAHAVNFRPR